jgi:hypothetical protein
MAYYILDVEVITASGIEQGNQLPEKLPIPRSVQARAAVASVGIHVGVANNRMRYCRTIC